MEKTNVVCRAIINRNLIVYCTNINHISRMPRDLAGPRVGLRPVTDRGESPIFSGFGEQNARRKERLFADTGDNAVRMTGPFRDFCGGRQKGRARAPEPNRALLP
eukprot:1433918-Heterocapsa_arctica.AAC.1